MLSISTVLILGLAAYLAHRLLFRKPSRLPPGPSGWGFVNMLFRKDDDIRAMFSKWGHQFPEIFTANMFGRPVVFLPSYELMRKVFVQHADIFSSRPTDMWLVKKITNCKGIIQNPNNWKMTRKFALHSLKDFGLGKSSLEERITDEAHVLCEQFRRRAGAPFNPAQDVTKCVSNIICSLAFGRRYQYDDEEFIHFLDTVKKVSNRNFSPLNQFPFLRHFGFLIKQFDVDLLCAPLVTLRDFLSKKITNHRETFNPEDIRDLVDLYIQAEKNDFQDMKGMDEENFFCTIMDLLLAGTDTTSTTITWILLHLINNPEVQTKCQQEIFKVVGRDKVPQYRERHVLPYTMATILESMRLDSVVMGTLYHTADEDFELEGYLIPKGTLVVGLHMNNFFSTEIWGPEPHKFRPERWLDERGEVRHVPEFIPFSLGRRACPGEQLAWTELFINAVVLLQTFTFRAEDPEDPPSANGKMGITYAPLPFNIVAVPLED